jgi:tripartite-type tricarboxylate transporter receptor subunit TctC
LEETVPTFRVISIALVALLATMLGASAQTYPNQTVRIVVPFSAGSITDGLARILADKLSDAWKQQVIVENRPGLPGTTGVAKSAPDGYTLMVYSPGFVVNKFVHKSLPYDAEKDFAPVTNLVSSGGLFLAVNPSIPANSMQEFIAYANKPEAKLAYSTPGIGNNWHLATEVFSQKIGIKMTHVPYKGGGPAVAALVAGEVQAMLASPAPLLPHYKNKRVKVLAYSGDKRNAAAPEVPTMKEAGVDYYYDGGWFGMFAPAKTPGEIVEALAREVLVAMQKREVKERMAQLGVEPAASAPAAFRKFMENEFRAYGEMVRLAGVQPE